MPICDGNLYTLKQSSFLFDKFWPETTVIDVIGYKKPDFKISDKMNFISIADAQLGGATSWSSYLKKYIDSIEDENIILILEDYFPTEKPNATMLSYAESIMKLNNGIGRFDISIDTQCCGGYTITKDLGNGAKLLLKDRYAEYRISTQPAIWSKAFLSKILSETTTPWDFEINGSTISSRYTEKIVAWGNDDFSKYPTRWIHKGSVSRLNEGKFNVLGLSLTTIKEMVDRDIFLEDDLIWGQWNGNVPTFKELGGYDFDLNDMPKHPSSTWQEYEYIYGNPKERVSLLDANFDRSIDKWGFDSCSDGLAPKLFKWDRDLSNKHDLAVFTDRYLHKEFIDTISARFKVGVILEPRSIHPWAYTKALEVEDSLDAILTFDNILLERGDKYEKLIIGSSRISSNRMKIYEKSKVVSIIASSKRMTNGHILRHDAIKDSEGLIDAYGNDYKSLPDKLDALKDYMFSVCIMNENSENYFTEILTDALLTGTVPIFWGCKNISSYFDIEGFLIFETLAELKIILKTLSIEKYNKMKPYVESNFNKALSYISTDDNIYKKIKEISS